MEEANAKPKLTFSDLGFYAVMGTFFFVPLFFLPSTLFPFQFAKTLLVLAFVVVGLIAFVTSALREGKVRFSWTWLYGALWALPLTYLVASLFSSAPALSFIGYQMGSETFAYVLLAALVAHLTSLLLTNSKARIVSVFMALLVSSWVVFLFQFVQILFGAPFAFLPNPSDNLIGRWNDFALFAGLIGTLSLFTLEALPLPKRHHLMILVTYVVALFFVVLTNMTEVLVLFVLASLGALIFSLSQKFLSSQPSRIKWQGVASFVGLIIALFFLVLGGGIANGLQQAFAINTLEVRPSLQSTINVMRGVYAENPLVGSGPNTFSAEWLQYRSPDIVQTPFWNLTFNAGSSALLTSIATGGVLVSLAWIIFLILLIYTGARILFLQRADDPRDFFMASVASLGALYLLLTHVLYSPSQSLTTLFFAFIGVLLASASGTSLKKTVEFSLRSTPRIGFAFILGGVLLSLIALGAFYGASTKFAGAYYHNKAIQVANAGDLPGGFALLNRAVQFDAQDRYYRTAALMSLADVNRIVQSGDSSQESQTAFQNSLASAVQATAIALEKNPKSFQNVMTRGLVFETVVPLGIDGAFENAVQVYEDARTLNPHDPEIDLRLAQMYAQRGDTESARAFISTALSKKADYTDAILLRAQIELNAGDLKEAIDTVKAAVFFEPQNQVLLYQLGILLLQDEDYESGAIAFEEALRIDSQFANAAYFLAQAYAFLDRYDEAAVLMERLLEQNPESTFLTDYIETLKGGDNPFDTTPVPLEEEEEVIE